MSLSGWLFGGAVLLAAPVAHAATAMSLDIVEVQPRVEPLLFRLELGFTARVFLGEPLLGGSVKLELGRHFSTHSVAGVARLEVGSGPLSLPYQLATTGAQFGSRLATRVWVGGGPELGALIVKLPYDQRIEWSILFGANCTLSVDLGRAGPGQFALSGRADLLLLTDATSPLSAAATLSLGYHL